MKSIFMSFPLMLLSTLYILICSFFYADSAWMLNEFTKINMISGVQISFAHGDLIIVVALSLLFLEILKSVSSSKTSLLNHALSVLNLLICVLLLVGNKNFANPIFLVVTLMSLFDVIAGYVISVVAARRDLSIEKSDISG